MISLSCTAENQWFCWWFRTTKPWFFLLMAMPTHESGEASFSTFFHSPKKALFQWDADPPTDFREYFWDWCLNHQAGWFQSKQHVIVTKNGGGAFQVWNATIASANFNGSVSGPAPRVPSGVLFFGGSLLITLGGIAYFGWIHLILLVKNPRCIISSPLYLHETVGIAPHHIYINHIQWNCINYSSIVY